MVMETLQEILVELGLERDELVPTARTRADLELDSTELVQLRLEIKRRLGVDIDLNTGADIALRELAEQVSTAVA